jgi:transposase
MDGGNEQRVSIKFCFKAGLSATETLVLAQKVFGNEALNRSNVCRWYSRFRDGRELVEDDERGGRPESLNIPKIIVLRILREDLGKRTLCARFFPTLFDI